MILSHPLKGTIKGASNFLLVNVSFCTIKGIFSHWCGNSLHGSELLYRGSLRFSSSLLLNEPPDEVRTGDLSSCGRLVL
jgi:hypothetical protein